MGQSSTDSIWKSFVSILYCCRDSGVVVAGVKPGAVVASMLMIFGGLVIFACGAFGFALRALAHYGVSVPEALAGKSWVDYIAVIGGALMIWLAIFLVSSADRSR